MEFTVELFGPVREAAGAPRATVQVLAPATAAGLLAALGSSRPELAVLLERARVAVNCAYVAPASPVTVDDEVAIIPPVGGG